MVNFTMRMSTRSRAALKQNVEEAIQMLVLCPYTSIHHLAVIALPLPSRQKRRQDFGGTRIV